MLAVFFLFKIRGENDTINRGTDTAEEKNWLDYCWSCADRLRTIVGKLHMKNGCVHLLRKNRRRFFSQKTKETKPDTEIQPEVQERKVNVVSREDFLLSQIDEFRERAKQLQSLLDSRETEAQELQTLVDERQEKADALGQILEERQKKKQMDSLRKWKSRLIV